MQLPDHRGRHSNIRIQIYPNSCNYLTQFMQTIFVTGMSECRFVVGGRHLLSPVVFENIRSISKNAILKANWFPSVKWFTFYNMPKENYFYYTLKYNIYRSIRYAENVPDYKSHSLNGFERDDLMLVYLIFYFYYFH